MFISAIATYKAHITGQLTIVSNKRGGTRELHKVLPGVFWHIC